MLNPGSTPILDAIPSIHATLLGLAGGFYSAFALFAYQRIHDANDQMSAGIETFKELCTPPVYVGSETMDANADGLLNWDGVKQELMNCARYASRQDYSSAPTEDHSRRAIAMVAKVLTHYPFSGVPPFRPMNYERAAKMSESKFTLERLSSLTSQLSFLNWYRDSRGKDLLQLARYEDKVETRAQIEQAADEGTKALLNSISGYRESALLLMFDKIEILRESALPSMRKSFATLDMYERRFQLKWLTSWAIGLSIWVLILGVVAPLVMNRLTIDGGVNWPPLVEYIFLVATFAPYFLSIWWIDSRTRK